jgi:predicted permease
MNQLLADLRFALRTMARSPLFATVAVLSLALGIGANTAIFTLLDQLMLRELPVKDPEQLVMLYQKGSHNGSNMGDRMHSYPIYQDYQTKAAPLAEVLCRRLVEASLSIDNQTERVSAEAVSGNYFTMLGVKPAVGRVFTSGEDDRAHMGHPHVVLSYDYWQSRFAGDPAVVGKKILVNNYPMTVVGVSARGFYGLDPAQAPQIRVPILMKEALAPEWKWVKFDDRRNRWVQVFARLKPGYTVASAQAPMQGLFRQVREYEATLPAAAKWTKYARDRFLEGTLHVVAADTGYSQLRNNVSKALVVLMCMVGLVLLIACANVANLLIARAFARQKEIAVRLSIGASRWQLVRQLLVESLLLSAVGGVAGVLLAMAMTRALLAWVPNDGTPLLINPEPDARVLTFTLALTVLTGLLFGLVPALRASRPHVWSTLKDAMGSIAGSGGSLFLRKSLVTAQVALSFLLLFGAGLFVRSLQNLKSKDTGFREMDRIVTFQVNPALNGYTGPRGQQFYTQLQAELRGLPGVKNAAIVGVPLLRGWEWDSSVTVEGFTNKDGDDVQAFMNALSPGYFDTMGIKLVEGRDFRPGDAKDNENERDAPQVAIVNQSFARHYFGNRSAVGRRFGFGTGPDVKYNIEIIGVVEDSLYEGPREGVHRQAFVPYWGARGAAIYVRTASEPRAAFTAMRQAVKRLDPSLPVYDLKTLSGQLDETLASEHLIALLSAGFGLLATLLASIGLYGVMAFAVMRRTKEMGVRMALGARRGEVLWLVMKEVLLLLGLGLAVGVPAALALGKYVTNQLYGVKATDPWMAAGTVAVLATVAALAGLIPARRASRIDPILALRYE